MAIRTSDIVIALLAGLVLAAIVHLLVVLQVPSLSRHDAFSRLALAGRSGQAELVTKAAVAPLGTGFEGSDPAAAVAACAFDLSEGPVRVSAPASGLMETLSLHARGGRVIYGLTDRASVRGRIDLTVMTQDQLDEAVAEEDDETVSNEIRVVSPVTQGLVVIRAIAARPSLVKQAQEAVTSVTCARDEREE